MSSERMESPFEKQDTDVGASSPVSDAPKWRRDFPIEWEGDHYVGRREMVKFLTLGSLLLAAANWATVIAGRLMKREIVKEQEIGAVSEVEKNGVLLFRYPTDKDPCIAVRTPEGGLVAYSQVCTHLSCAVYYAAQENKLLCPCHRGAFDVATGAPTGGPPTRALAKVEVQRRGDKLVAIRREIG